MAGKSTQLRRDMDNTMRNPGQPGYFENGKWISLPKEKHMPTTQERKFKDCHNCGHKHVSHNNDSGYWVCSFCNQETEIKKQHLNPLL